MDDCIFCKIVKGELPSYKIYEDGEFYAFLDIFPATEGYTLVIPKTHYRWVWDVENIGRYFEVCQKIAKHFQKAGKSDAVYSMIVGEEVPHAHIRIFSAQDSEFRNKVHEFLQNTQPKNMLSQEIGKEVVEKYRLDE